jgi:hypothetical protein
MEIVGSIVAFLQPKLSANVWDGEVPRFDALGQPINPQALNGAPSNWPAFTCYTNDTGFTTTWTTEDPYYETGSIFIDIYGSSRAQVQPLVDTTKALLISETNWAAINIPGAPDPSNPYYVIQILPERASVRQTGLRDATNQMIYRGAMEFYTQVHGAVSTA